MPGNLDALLRRKRRRLRCCVPYRRSFPSGVAWAHSRFCSSPRRGQKLGTDELAELGAAPAAALPTLTPEEADRVRPTGELALRCWFAHPLGCPCFGCRYTEEHADDD